MRLLPSLLTLALLAGCAQAGMPTASSQAAKSLQAAEAPVEPDTRVNPDDAQKRAVKKAQEWSADARLVGVGWAMAKFELTSVVFHVFQSNKQGKLLIVESKLVSFWQNTREISDKRLTLPARLLDTLDEKYISSEQALDAAKSYLKPGTDHPVAFLVLWKPNRFTPALWGIKVDEQKVLIHAASGKVLLHTDIGIPVWPFGDLEAATPTP
jgi:hypothetical protein